MDPLKLTIDIGVDIPHNIGSINRKIRSFSKKDIPAILDSVAAKIKAETKKQYVIDIIGTLAPEEYILWDLSFFGNIHPGVFGDVSILLSRWDEVHDIEYIQPYGIPYHVYSVDDNVNVNYVKF